jgi:hypothetical protein
VASGNRQALLEAVRGHLLQDITSGALTAVIQLDEGTWPTEFPFYAVLGESTSRFEIVKVDGIAGQTHTIVRGQLGTVASAHPKDEPVVLNVNRADVARLLARLEQVPGGGGGTPSGTVVSEIAYGQSATAGVASEYSRGDHTHGSPTLSAAAPTTSAVGDAAANGSATAPAKADHLHGREAFGSPGSSAVADTPSAGAAATPARSDHRHGRESFGSPGASGVGDTGLDGAATTLARADHRHQREAFGAVVAETAYGQASGNGAATTVARSDHTHGTPAKHTQEITFSRVGALVLVTGAMRWYPGRAITITAVRASVGSAPGTTAVIVDVNKVGTTIFTTQSNRPTIAVGTTTDLANAINVPAVGASDYLTVDIDQIGDAGAPGSDLTVTIVYTVD